MDYLYKTYKWKEDAFAVFDIVKDRDNIFFLDSNFNFDNLGRYSFIGFEPSFTVKTKGREKPFREIKSILNKFRLPKELNKLSPFLCGFCGYLSYDLGLCMENIKMTKRMDLDIPTSFFGFYDTVITIDHLKRNLTIFASGFPERSSRLKTLKAKESFDKASKALSSLSGGNFNYGAVKLDALSSNFNCRDYIKAVKKAKEYIAEGEIYQINLSQRFKGACNYPAPSLYYRLRRSFPAPFSAYFNCSDFDILSCSPERFLKVNNTKVITRPMKGTRPRGRVSDEDNSLKAELLNSEKDKAELLMIVDLERNDLGRVCEYKSVKVTKPRVLEAYTTVFQTTAQVEGRLHKNKDCVDLITACFPGGSITGCPKIRAMQIIEELEPARRNIYTGSLGYLGLGGNMDFNILIRSALLKDKQIYFQAGGGIVADSLPQAEYDETLVKAKAIFRALGACPVRD